MRVERSPRSGRRPLRARVVLTAAQARALQAMAVAPDASLRGISWMTARALRALGLCELGPGRRGRITRAGRTALVELARAELAAAPTSSSASTSPTASGGKSA